MRRIQIARRESWRTMDIRCFLDYPKRVRELVAIERAFRAVYRRF